MVFTPVQSTLAVQGLGGVVASVAVNREKCAIEIRGFKNAVILMLSAECAPLIHSGFVASLVPTGGHLYLYLLPTICRDVFKLFILIKSCARYQNKLINNRIDVSHHTTNIYLNCHPGWREIDKET